MESFLGETWKTSIIIISGDCGTFTCAFCVDSRRRADYVLEGRQENGKMARLLTCIYHKDKFDEGDHWVLNHLRVVHGVDPQSAIFRVR